MKKIALLIGLLFVSTASLGSHSWVQQIDNQSFCTLQRVDHYHSADATNHNAPLTIEPYSIAFIETEGTGYSQYIDSYMVVCDKKNIGMGFILNNNGAKTNQGWPETNFFFEGEGQGIFWGYRSSWGPFGYPAYLLVKNT